MKDIKILSEIKPETPVKEITVELPFYFHDPRYHRDCMICEKGEEIILVSLFEAKNFYSISVVNFDPSKPLPLGSFVIDREKFEKIHDRVIRNINLEK